MNTTQDFGFAGEEFTKESVPYAQFFNADAQKYGIAVTANNAELAEFELSDNWQPIEHQFRDGANEILFFTREPNSRTVGSQDGYRSIYCPPLGEGIS
jgi:hypothetical protein